MTYTRFNETKDTGKTKVWAVTNINDGSYLGDIKWHGAWRKYVFAPVQVWCIFSADCLRDIADFIEKQMTARRAPRETACPDGIEEDHCCVVGSYGGISGA